MSNIPLEDRKNWIGGSEIAALFGLSPYGTEFELYHRKKGNLQELDLDSSERVQAGNFMEPAIAAWASDKFGLHLRRVRRYMTHPAIEGYGTSLDYETVTGHYPAEIKNVDGLIFRDNWEVEGDKIIDAPMHITLQLQAQMACANKDKGYLIVCVGGNRLYWMEMEAHKATHVRLEKAVSLFWQRVANDSEPSPDFVKDASAIADLYRVSGDEVLDLKSDNYAESLAHDYAAAAADEKDAANRKKAAKSEMLMKIGSAGKVFLSGFTISAKTTKDSEIEAHTRKGYRGFRVTKIKTKNEGAAA
ncbi:MAG: YqaJ viral recombinase family protein [Kordiimonadaceae bacterium]|nr:YqaJ viral recombinase family protein [Kordiimonadaceae bacterium]